MNEWVEASLSALAILIFSIAAAFFTVKFIDSHSILSLGLAIFDFLWALGFTIRYFNK